MNLVNVIVKLGDLIVKCVIQTKTQDKKTISILRDVSEFAKELIPDVLEQRAFTARFFDLSKKIVSACSQIIDKYNDISDERKEEIVNLLIDGVESLDGKADVFSNSIKNAENFRKIIFISAEKKASMLELDEREQGLYSALVSHSTKIIYDCFIGLPSFSLERTQAIFTFMNNMSEEIDVIEKMLISIEAKLSGVSSDCDEFERNYINRIISEYGYVNLFGSDDFKNSMRQYRLSTAYVQLEMEMEGKEEQITIDRIFAENKSVWISGEAGSGKTTCLSWLATQIAADGVALGMRGRVPIVIELRKYKEDETLGLSKSIQKVFDDQYTMVPQKWIDKKISEGGFAFLIDGFDEVSPERRREVFNWLIRIDPDNTCYKAFSSRPQIKDRPEGSRKPIEVRILPMDLDKIDAFVTYWHVAVLAENMGKSEDVVHSYIQSLIHYIHNDDLIRKLIQNPLLCAMTCALHFNTDRNIPNSKRDLYESCCKMLIQDRDRDRNIVNKNINVGYGQKKIIVSRLAYYMILNNCASEMARSDLEDVMAVILKDMGLDEQYKTEFMDYLIERTGLIREPSKGLISFVHNSFRDYLCACELVRQANWGLIKSKIGDEQWLEIICLSIGEANKKTANEILSSTLRKARYERKSKKYLFYAIEYMAAANEVDEEIREEIKKRINLIIPPNMFENNNIYRAGNIAVPHLRYKDSYSMGELYECVKVLLDIGTVEAFREALRYLGHKMGIGTFCLIGRFIDSMPRSVLLQEGVPGKIANHIKLTADERIVIPAGIIYALNMLSDKEMNEIASKKLSSATIIEFKYSSKNNVIKDKKNYIIPKVLCDCVRELEVDGEFDKAVCIQNFHSLNRLKLRNKKINYKYEELNQYKETYKIKSFACSCISYTVNTPLIEVQNLGFLRNCEELYFDFKDCSPTIVFGDACDKIPIKRVTIIADNAFEYDYSSLHNLEELKVITAATIYEMKSRISGKVLNQIAKTTTIQARDSKLIYHGD